jgi:hypothetical protein
MEIEQLKLIYAMATIGSFSIAIIAYFQVFGKKT